MRNASNPLTESHSALYGLCELASHSQAAARKSNVYKQQKFLTLLQEVICQIFLCRRNQTIGIIIAST
jgi:hypothetical protein